MNATMETKAILLRNKGDRSQVIASEAQQGWRWYADSGAGWEEGGVGQALHFSRMVPASN